jgi:hypothetical protein
MRRLGKGCLLLVGVVVVLVIVVQLCSGPSETPAESITPTEPLPTAVPTKAAAATPMPETVTYFCGIDRCKGSGEYGQMIFETGITIWENHDPDGGARLRYANHRDRAVIVNEVVLGDGVGEHWYELKDGGWTNGLWLTEEPCTPENLEKYTEDC